MHKIIELNKIEKEVVAGGTNDWRNSTSCDFHFDCRDSDVFFVGKEGPCAPLFEVLCADQYECIDKTNEGSFLAKLGYGTLIGIGVVLFVGTLIIRRAVRIMHYKIGV